MIDQDVTKAQSIYNDHSDNVESYKRLLETLNVVPWEYHWEAQKFLYVGPQASIFGYPVGDWYEEGFLSKIIHPEDFDVALQYCKSAAENQQDYEYEYRIVQADGNNCWVRKIVRVLAGSNGSTVLRGMFIDISAQKQAEKILATQNSELCQRDRELKEKNEQFNTAINNMSQGLCMFDSEQRLIVCNARYASMYQLPPELTKSGTPIDKIAEHRIAKGIFPAVAHKNYIRQCLIAIRQQDAVAPKPHTVIQEYISGGFVETSRMPMASGGWISTHEDITERRKTQKSLEESQEFLSIAFRATPVAMAIAEIADGGLIEVNEAWSEMLGYSYEEALASSALKLCIWLNADDRIRFVRQIIEEGTVRGFETKYCTKDGRVLDVLLSGESAEMNGKQRLLVTSHDITNQKITEKEIIDHRDHLQEMVDIATVELKTKAEELEKSLNKERELNELQRQFVSMASHEFRTPLAIIDSTAQRLTKLIKSNRLTPEDALERLDKIRSAVQRMATLMESTLRSAQMDEGKIKIEIAPCQFGNTVREVCLRQQEITKNHTISCHLSNIPEFIQADMGALEQVLTNLLTNAEKYSPITSEIEVKAYRQGHEVIVSVRDQGIGIDGDDLERIGERFFRAKTSTGIPGTGIGLNLSSKLLEMHEGSLHVTSEKMIGSTFFIHLPIAGPVQSHQEKSRVA